MSKKKDPVIDLDDDMFDIYPPFLLITSTGPAADYQDEMFGLYRRTVQMTEGRIVYLQEHDISYGANPGKLFSDQGVWSITRSGVVSYLRAATPSECPTNVKWQHFDIGKKTLCDDPALTVTSLSEKPSCECEVTISLSQEIERDILPVSSC